jgi:glycosyltransferase involved in cell wall biosynthesis
MKRKGSPQSPKALTKLLKSTSSDMLDVAIIIPVHNAAAYLPETLESIAAQTYPHQHISVHICDDGSTDGTTSLLQEWISIFASKNIRCVLSTTHDTSKKDNNFPLQVSPTSTTTTTAEQQQSRATGAGNAKNIAVSTASSDWLCFIDADDMMFPTRIEEQHCLAMSYPHNQRHRLLVGSGFVRLPSGSTNHYTNWCNSLTKEQLVLQQYREVTVIQPTWFLARRAFDAVGGYQLQTTQGTKTPIPSDLIFFHSHLDHNGLVDRVQKPLVTYRYLKGSVSWKIPRKTLLRVRLRALERRVLEHWSHFTIWGAGRDGKTVINELQEKYLKRCVGFCDVDEKKISRGYCNPRRGIKLPVVHFSEVKPPLLICVAMGRTGGELEKNIASLGLTEGVDYWHLI